MLETLAILEIPNPIGKRELFRCLILQDDESRLIVSLHGEFLNFYHYDYSVPFIKRLRDLLPQCSFTCLVLDITRFEFLDGPCLYTVMDIVDLVYELVSAPSFLCVRQDDEWQHDLGTILISKDDASPARAVLLEVP